MHSRAFDRQHLWHPYSQVTAPGPVHLVKSVKGVRLTLDDGTQMIDAMASWWCAIHGYGQPSINAAVKDQMDRMAHVMFGGLTHDPAAELGKRLLQVLPPSLQRIFYCDSGSVSVEVAMKMAVQYQHATGHPAKNRFLTIRNGYHGDTWKAMSVCDPVTGMHHLFQGAMQIQHFAEKPPVGIAQAWQEDAAANGLGDLTRLLADHHAELAAVILEPVVQGAGGMYFYHPEYLNQCRSLCDQFDVLLIFDEIATGFGRTGQMFATDHTHVAPDIICLGKAITGGTLSFAATVASDKVAIGIGGSDPGVFMHGPTFMANPLACAAACASFDLLMAGDWQAQVGAIEAQMRDELERARSLPNVAEVRCLGAIGVIEMDHLVSQAQAHGLCKELGVWLRPFGRNIYCMPPYVISADDLSRVTYAMRKLAEDL